jgi:transposase
MFGVAWHTVSAVDLARLKKLPRPQLSGLKRLAIDENYLGTRHGFVTVVLDHDSMAIVSVLKGRGKAALAPFFAQLKQAQAKIKAVAIDMSGGYIAAVMEHLPKAALVFDRFHVVKLMNEKLSDLRREMYHELTDKLHRKVLKGTRWLLVMNGNALFHIG